MQSPQFSNKESVHDKNSFYCPRHVLAYYLTDGLLTCNGLFSLLCILCSLLFQDIILLCITVFLLCTVLFIVLVLHCVCL
jgi:hypothetical protein